MSDPKESWESWLDEHGAALVLFARQWTESHADAEDVVQEAFIRFWRTGRQRAADPKAYLFAAVRRTALNLRRGDRRRTQREEAAGQAAPPEPMFRTPLEADEWRAAVEAALADLPDEQREVLVLKVWARLTFPQIAEALGIPANTAASRFRYALGTLRERLSEKV